MPVPVEELWTWITESDKTARWYGPWRGDGRVGSTVTVRMAAEEGAPDTRMRVEACDAPRLLTLVADNPPPFAFPIDLVCEPDGDGSTIALRHRQIPDALSVADLGPGWELYLDHLVCAIAGREGDPFEAYVADLRDAYAALT